MNVYEVQLSVSDTGASEKREVTRREWAYDALDAAKQAFLNQVADAGPRGAQVVILHVGPPAADIQKAEASIAAQLGALVDRIASAERRT